jgi:hypothetical protein
VELVIFTQSRCDNFLQIKSHRTTLRDVHKERKW